jgi:hypothetical protein
VSLQLFTIAKLLSGTERNRTADAGLFRAAYRIDEVVWKSGTSLRLKALVPSAIWDDLGLFGRS